MPFPESFNGGPIPSSSEKGGSDQGHLAGGLQLFQSDVPDCLLRSYCLLDRNKQAGDETSEAGLSPHKQGVQTYINSKEE